MFRRNRAIQVSMVKTPKVDNPTEPKPECKHRDPKEIAEIAKDFVTHTGKIVGGVILTYAAATAVTKILDNLTKSDDQD